MRILVHGLVGTNLGGIETFLLNMNEFMSEDCIFDYVIEEDTCMHIERIKKKGGIVYQIASRNEQPIKHIKDIIKLYKGMKKEYTTIYYNLSSASWIVPELIAKLCGYRVVVHSHNAMLIDANNNCIYKIVNCINRFILGHMKIVRLSCSKLATDFLFGNAGAEVIYNGIDVQKYMFSEKVRKEVREQYAIGESTFVVGVVGRLAYQKNPLFSIKIFNEICKSIEDCKMLMIGNGKLKEDIEKEIQKLGLQEKVFLLGNIDNVYDVLNAMDVFLLPSRHEGLGIALIEAQANGIPCYTSKDVVPQEAKVTELLNYISLDSDEKEWANEMICKKILDRKQYNLKLRESKYNIDVEAKKLERILTEIED